MFYYNQESKKSLGFFFFSHPSGKNKNNIILNLKIKGERNLMCIFV